MEHVDPTESGEQVPLMNKSFSSRHCNDEISEEEEGHQNLPHNKHSDRTAPAIILGFECLESIAYFGISTNLIVYLGSVLHGSNASNAANVTTWTGTCYFTPLIGAVIADTFLGNYKTIAISLVVYLIGTLMITLSALSPSSNLVSANEAQNLAFFSGLYLVAIGSGGVKSSLLPFGADQFGNESIEERERKSSFFSLFYMCMNVGVLFSSTLIVWIQENVAWALGFGITAVCIALALGGFLLGTPAYHLRAPSGSPLKAVLQVLVAAFRKARLEAPSSSMLLYEVDDKMAQDLGHERLVHTDEFRFLDKAAIISDMDMEENLCNSWNVCTVTRVEELKILIRLLPIWIAGVFYSAAYAQTTTTFIQQGTAMNTTIGSFSIPPASLVSFEVVSVVACVAASNRLAVHLARRCLKNETGLSLLQRIGIGQSLMVLAMAAAASVEFRRLDGARAGEPMSIAWQLPQYFLVACSEVFCFISQHEFFYSQAPETMKSMCTSFSLLAISVGSYLSSLIVTLFARFEPGGLSEGHFDVYFLMFTGLCALNCACYFVSAMRHTPKQVIRAFAVGT